MEGKQITQERLAPHWQELLWGPAGHGARSGPTGTVLAGAWYRGQERTLPGRPGRGRVSASPGVPGATGDTSTPPTLAPTSPTALERMWTIFSWGVATTLCPLISMIRCPTRTPPRSAIPPRMRLQICRGQRPRDPSGQHHVAGRGVGMGLSFLGPCPLIPKKLLWLLWGQVNLLVSFHDTQDHAHVRSACHGASRPAEL